MQSSTVLFGGTGYVGSLILTEILRSTSWRVILPVRPGRCPSQVLNALRDRCVKVSGHVDADFPERVRLFDLPARDRPIRLPPEFNGQEIARVINAAGNVNYFAEAELYEANLGMTRRTLEFTRCVGSPDYVYISSAFSAGYREGRISEELQEEPETDPTTYTRTKRLAERMIASSGLRYLIVRPSVLIGDSRTGVYTGKPYGLYQFLKSFTYFVTDRYYPEVHVVAPEQPFHLLHQDTFMALFMQVLREVPSDRIVNLVSPVAGLPTATDLYAHFFAHVTRPAKAFLYDRIEDVPLDSIPRRQRMFLHITRVNGQIMGRPWAFDRNTVAALESKGIDAPPTTAASTQNCMDAYIRESPKCQRYYHRYRWCFPARTNFVKIRAPEWA